MTPVEMRLRLLRPDEIAHWAAHFHVSADNPIVARYEGVDAQGELQTGWYFTAAGLAELDGSPPPTADDPPTLHMRAVTGAPP